MRPLFIIFLNLFFSFSSFAMESFRLHEEARPDFALNHDFLQVGNIQYFSSHLEQDDIRNFSPQLLALDVQGHLKKKNVQLLFYKTAYTLPLRANAVFEQNLYSNIGFMHAINSRLKSVKFFNPKNTLEQEHIFPAVKGFPGLTIFTIENFEASIKERVFFDAIAPLYETKLLTPRTMITKTTGSNQKELLCGINYTSYYPYGTETLVVSYKIGILEPGLKLKLAFKTGIAQHFLKNESDSLIESVKRARHFIESTIVK